MADGTAPEPFAPQPGDILAGGVVVNSSGASTPFLTIPAGRTWRGNVAVTCAEGTTGALDKNTQVVTAGAGAVPAPGTIVAVANSKRDTAPGSVVMPEVYVSAPSGNSVTLNLLNSSAAASHTGSAAANGILL